MTSIPVGQRSKSHKKQITDIRRLQIQLENEIMYGYDCQVCKVTFRSRHELATHPHGGGR